MTTIAGKKYNRESLERQYTNIVNSLHTFAADVPDEDSARKKLFAELAEGKGIACECGVVGMPSSDSTRFFVCSGCKRKVWITANTFFADVRKVRPWLAMIWLMEHGVPFNPHQVHDLIHVSPSTAAEMKRKLDYLISKEMPADSPAVPSVFFTDLFCRRTTETPAREHPRAEQIEVDRARGSAPDEGELAPHIVPEGSDGKFSEALDECEQAVWDQLSDEFISFDRLACRSGLPDSVLNTGIFLLKLRGLVKESHGTYARVSQASLQLFDLSHVPTENFKKFVRTFHQGIGRRTVQWYLASFWCLVDRQRWGPGKLLKACVRARPVKLDDLRRYVSPRFVKILPQVNLVAFFVAAA